MFRRSVLIVAFVICLPVLWGALVEKSITLDAAGIRFLIALPVAAILVGVVRLATRPSPANDHADDTADAPGSASDRLTEHPST